MAQSVSIAVMSWTPSYFTRVHHWTPSEVGIWFGTAVLVAPLIGLLGHGWICDKLLARGVQDIHLRYQFFILPLALGPLCAAYLMPNAMVALVLLGTAVTFLCGSGAICAASLQLAVPGDQRGKAASIWVLVGGIAPIVGPSGVAAINQHIFKSSGAVGQSLAVYCTGATVLALMLFMLARGGFSRMDQPN
ncbi:hypothetical protein sphantq_04754 (plasmid) [Sphingobium sp. AntQ-1]|uniref:hypothetical protein n=1 Tax=Sphingobium sp. AntQ-1 TaxID=2930091 RepID=UPI00234F9967|nr:hypothetical protein [Sphingobium sp. AntQ-1]WCP16258.1 hypothetical protein sphantq_04754 [Sphingobium sp. AntQ-1]